MCSLHCKAALGVTGTMSAYDRVIIPRHGSLQELHTYMKAYGKLGTVELQSARCVATLAVTNPIHDVSFADLALVLDIINDNWPEYKAREHQCYWMSAMIFSFVERRTGLIAQGTEHVDSRGKLYGLRARSGSEEEREKMTQAEFDLLWNEFLVR